MWDLKIKNFHSNLQNLRTLRENREYNGLPHELKNLRFL